MKTAREETTRGETHVGRNRNHHNRHDNHSGLRRHKLMTKELADTIPPLYANDGADDPDAVVARVKLFSPYSNWTWYIAEWGRRPEPASAYSRGSRSS